MGGPAGCRQRVVLKRLAWMLTVALVLSELFYHSVNWLWQRTNQLPPLIKRWEVQESVTNDGWWFFQVKKIRIAISSTSSCSIYDFFYFILCFTE